MRRRLLLWLLGAKLIELRPGDLLVLKTPDSTHEAEAHAIGEELRRVLPLGVKALIVRKSFEVHRDTAGNVPPTPTPPPAVRRS